MKNNKINSCLNKIKYSNYQFALDEIIELEKLYNKKFKIYYCKLCNGFHAATKK